MKSLNSSPPNLFIYFEGPFYWWTAMRRPDFMSITFNDVIERFLSNMNQVQETSFTINQISAYIVDATCDHEKPIINLGAQIKTNSMNTLELFLRLNEEEKIAKVSQVALDVEAVFHFIKEARIFEKKGDYPAALNLYRASEMHGFYELAKMLSKQKSWALLIGNIENLLYLFPNDFDIAYMCGLCCENLKDYDRAWEYYKKTLKISSRPEITTACSRICFKKRDYKLGILMMTHTVLNNVNDPDIIIHCARINYKFKQYGKMLELCFRKAFETKLGYYTKCVKYFASKTKKNNELAEYALHHLQEQKFTNEQISMIASILANTRASYVLFGFLHNYFISVAFEPQVILIFLDNAYDYQYFEYQQTILLKFFDAYDVKLPNFRLRVFRETFKQYLGGNGIISNPDMDVNFIPLDEVTLTTFQEYIICCCMHAAVLMRSIGHLCAFRKLSEYLDIYKDHSQIEHYDICHIFSLMIQTDEFHIINHEITNNKGMIIGYHRVISYGFDGFEYNNKLYVLDPKVMSNKASIYKLRKGSKSFAKDCFWNIIMKGNIYDFVILHLGEVDCRFVIPKKMNQLRYRTVEEAVSETIDIYLYLIEKILRLNPNITVMLLPVLDERITVNPIIIYFNNELKKRIEKFNKPRCKFLNLNLTTRESPFSKIDEPANSNQMSDVVQELLEALKEL